MKMGQTCGRRAILAPICTLVFHIAAIGEPPGKTLLVVAHPDDEYYFAATVYRMAVQLSGQVDELIVTDGEGGFRYSTLAEPYYKTPLTIEAIGRKELPEIRKKEALNAGKVLGIKRHFFLGQKDERFTTDEDSGLHGWDSTLVIHKIAALVRENHYQYVFSILPRSTTHGEHQAATALAADAIRALPENIRPVLLGFDTDPANFQPAQNLQEGQKWSSAHVYAFDRTTRFGFHNALSYQIIVDWMIAEHKSQGLLQTMCGRDAREYAWIDLASGLHPQTEAQTLFRKLDNGSGRQGGEQ